MGQSIVAIMSGARVLRKYVGRPFLLANEWVWYRLSSSITTTRPMCLYGTFMHSLVKLRSARRQRHGTFFFRNRPELELIGALSNQRAKDSTLRVCVLACSNGAEVYTTLWTIRSARPDLKVILHAVDISNEVLEIGKDGLYSPKPNDLARLIREEGPSEEFMEFFGESETTCDKGKTSAGNGD
jgi:CheR methyltransferase, SAM binding domain